MFSAVYLPMQHSTHSEEPSGWYVITLLTLGEENMEKHFSGPGGETTENVCSIPSASSGGWQALCKRNLAIWNPWSYKGCPLN